MKKILPYYLLFLSATLVGQRCYVSDVFHNQQLSKDLEVFTKNYIQQSSAKSRSNIEIPVVIHIVWNTEEQNISEEQIHSQIDALNRDFQLLNEDTSLVDSTFKPIIGHANISFYLATFDEEGKPTNGITRTETEFENIARTPIAITSPIYYTDQGGKDAWDTKRYLNIWVGEMPAPSIGFASRPGQRIPVEDGVIIDYRHFGTIGTVQPPNHLGRTATHEVGHYLNLLHIHGDNANDCRADDMIEDTPFQTNNYQDCQADPISTCDSKDLTVNYMNWVPDDCMVMFTKGQVARMIAAIEGARFTLLDPLVSSTKETTTKPTLVIAPNPATHHISIQYANFQQPLPFQLINLQGSIIEEGILNKEDNKIPVSHLPRGVYLLACNTSNGYLTKKLLLH